MGGARGKARANAPRALSLALLPSCPRNNPDGDKVPSGHFIIFIMPTCELLSVIFARKIYL